MLEGRSFREYTSADLAEVNFHRMTTSPGREVFYENMCGSDPVSRLNSVMTYLELDVASSAAMALEAMRHLAARGWKMILPASCSEAVHQLADYHLETGIVASSDLHNLVLLPEHVDYNNHESVVRHLRESGVGSSLLSYMPSPHLIQLCEEHGINAACWNKSGIGTVIDRFSNRSNLRDLVGELREDKSFAVDHRIRIGRDHRWERNDLAKAVLEAAEWNLGYKSPTSFMLFMQYCGGSGGNYPIDHALTVHGYQFERSHERIDDLVDWLLQIAETNELEVNPYTRVTAAYSFGVVVGDDHLSSLGPRHQLLDRNQSYRGFEYSTLPSEAQERYTEARALAHKIGEVFHDMGYRGAFGVDLFEYETPAGEKRTAVSETNLRLDGTTPYTGLFFKIPSWHDTLFVEGARIAQLSVPLPEDIDSSSPDALSGSLAHFRTLGIPLARAESPHGVFALNVPVGKGGRSTIAVGLCAKSDEEFNSWMTLLDADR